MRNNNIQKRAIAILLIMAMLMGSFTFGVAANTIFKDVHSNDWFYEDVNFVESEGLMQGVGNGRFDPNGAATRAMMATIFWRFEDTPEPAEMSGYRDVPNGQWYSDAIAWMKEVGLTNGAGNNKYGTNDPVTREELATFFYRYAIFKGYNVEEKNSLSNYSDCGKIHNWAIEGLSWANVNGIVSGRTPTMMAPQGTATRAEIAAMIHRFIVNVVEVQELPSEDPTEPSVEPTEPTDMTEPTEPTGDPIEPTDTPTEPTTAPDVPTELTEPTDPTEPTEPSEKTATVILMVDDIYGEEGQYPNYRFALRLDSTASMYGEYFDDHGLIGDYDPYDLDEACCSVYQNAYEDRTPGETDEVSIEVPVGTYDVLIGCRATPGQFMPEGIFVPDNSAYDDFEITEGKVYVFYVSAKGYNKNTGCIGNASYGIVRLPSNCTGTAVTLFVGDGEKPEIDTAQLPHCHNWERVEHEEVKIGIYKIRCACGWTRCVFDSELEGDVDGEWYDIHCKQYTPSEQQAYHNSYSDVSYSIVVSPAYSSWVCADCGEERWVSPGALDECECHTWERVRFRENDRWLSTRVCSCGWESDLAPDDTSYAADYKQFLAHKEASENPEDHRCVLHPQRRYVVTPSYDVWICTHCGKISHEQPEADEYNHVDTEKVWLYSQAVVCNCGWKLTTETSAYYGDFRMDIIDHKHMCDKGLESSYNSVVWNDCWTLLTKPDDIPADESN